MAGQEADHISRRAAILSFCLAAAQCSSYARGQEREAQRSTFLAGQPLFLQTGPTADLYGAADHYPVPGFIESLRHGNPFSQHYRVGAFSHADEVYATRRIRRADTASSFQRRSASLIYRPEGRPSSVEDYLARNPITGLLIAQDDAILCERYQYGRTDRDRMLGQSMTKSIVGLLTGTAASVGAIRSVDDRAEAYMPALAGSEYGRTRLRDLLHMASGISFGEEAENGRDLRRLWRYMVVGSWFGLGPSKSTVASLIQFNQRIAPAGERFAYASIEPDVLGVVLRAALHKTLSEYLSEAIWRPIGTEADATWALDAEGSEIGHFGFSAVLRDWARLGRLLAWDGMWNGRQIISSQWMRDATSVSATEAFLAPGHATPWLGYGYLVWLLPGPRRQFAFLGQNGQRLCVDPAAKLILVQTALEDTPEFWRLWAALVAQFGQG